MRQQWTDEYYMRQALDLALRGLGKTAPNPMVGCVLVRDGEIVGRGWHDRLGGLHAEAAALRDAGGAAQGATAYVTLEPCSHQGRQPPCAPALVDAGVVRCVCAVGDPNPQVCGRGLKILRDAGVETVCGVLEKEAVWLNRGFLSLQTRRRPWVTLKAALSLDGSMALVDGTSRWITGEAARCEGHRLRSENDAVLTGSGTLRHDDPALTVRAAEGPSPRPVILCADASVWEGNYQALRGDAIVFVPEGTLVPPARRERTHAVPADAGRLRLKNMLEKLAELGVARLLVEAGPTVCSSFIGGGLADEYQLFVAPLFMGEGRKITESLRLERMDDAVPMTLRNVHRAGNDLWIEGGNPCSLAWLKQ